MKRRDFVKKGSVGLVAGLTIPSIVPSSVFGKNAPSNKINIGQEIPFGQICSSLISKSGRTIFGLVGPMRMNYSYNLKK